jgi:hypothetical protein
MRSHDKGSAFALLSKDFRERLRPALREIKEMYIIDSIEGKPIVEWKLGAKRPSESKEQATFNGFAQTKDGREYPFQLVLVKEGDAWRVNLFSVQE